MSRSDLPHRWSVGRLLAVGLLTSVAVLLLALPGHRLTRARVSDGVNEFPAGIQRTVAADAVDLMQVMVWDHPLGRIGVPAVRVVAVEHRPGHCSDPARSAVHAEYVARVRIYTWFLLPVRTYRVSCGGWRV